MLEHFFFAFIVYFTCAAIGYGWRKRSDKYVRRAMITVVVAIGLFVYAIILQFGFLDFPNDIWLVVVIAVAYMAAALVGLKIGLRLKA